MFGVSIGAKFCAKNRRISFFWFNGLQIHDETISNNPNKTNKETSKFAIKWKKKWNEIYVRWEDLYAHLFGIWLFCSPEVYNQFIFNQDFDIGADVLQFHRQYFVDKKLATDAHSLDTWEIN